MRPIETLLSLANLLTLFVLAIPLPRVVFSIRYWVPIALLTAVAQVLVEGARWQMVPAYALTGMFVLVWLRNIAVSDGPAGQILTKRLAVGLGIFGLVVSVVLPIILPVFRFSHPSGPYEIGTLTYHWVDADRPEFFTADPHVRRELVVQIWYPAKENRSSQRAPYLHDAGVLGSVLARLHHLPEFTFGHLKYIITNAIPSAAVADDKPSYPVLIFLEGLTGFRHQMNTFQVEALASHGYIVAAIDQPYSASVVVFPDGRKTVGLPIDQMKALIRPSLSPVKKALILNGRALENGIVPYLAQDTILTLDQLAALNQADPSSTLTGRLDLRRIGVFGISLGGIVVGEACRLDRRLRACLVMDAPMPAEVVQAGLKQPSMWITRDAKTMQLEGWPQAEIDEHQTTMPAVFASLAGDGYFERVPGMSHANLTDIPYWSLLWSWMGVTGPIAGQRAHNIINAYSLAFFDRYLKSHSAVLLDGLAQQYPEVLFEARRP